LIPSYISPERLQSVFSESAAKEKASRLTATRFFEEARRNGYFFTGLD
jgi:hypothetical protein